MPDVHIEDLIISKYDDVLFDILDHRHSKYTFAGGRGCTKSSFVGMVIPLLITQNSDAHAICFRRYANTLKDSVYAEILSGITKLGMSHLFKATKSPLEITYLPTGQKILFRGFDEPEKIKSVKAPFGYFAISWYEELDQLPGRTEIRKTTQSTERGGDAYWRFESFNPPISAQNWANKDLLIHDEDRLIINTATYLDVPMGWLGEHFFNEAELLKATNERAYRHEYLGEAVGTGGMVFENIRAEVIPDALIVSFDKIRNGVDWGYYPDPWTFNRVHFDRAARVLYIFHEERKLKKSARETAPIVKALIRPGEIVTCDNQPSDCSDYRDFGVAAQPAQKGPDSRKYSYEWLQSLKAIWIDPVRCPRTLEEFTSYEYERDKAGDIISGYPDENDHHIDAVRYATEAIWRRRGQ